MTPDQYTDAHNAIIWNQPDKLRRIAGQIDSPSQATILRWLAQQLPIHDNPKRHNALLYTLETLAPIPTETEAR